MRENNNRGKVKKIIHKKYIMIKVTLHTNLIVLLFFQNKKFNYFHVLVSFNIIGLKQYLHLLIL